MADPDPVVLFLAVDGRADRLAAEHADDGRGYCNLANVAAAAREVASGDDRRPDDGTIPCRGGRRRGNNDGDEGPSEDWKYDFCPDSPYSV